MAKRIVSLLLILTLCFGCLTAMTGCDKTPDIIRLPITETPSSFDPQIASGDDAQSVLNNCFEGLVRIDSEGNIVPGVAQSWTISDDGLTYTFTLRENATWHVDEDALETVMDEEEAATFDNRVTADDFVFAMQRAVEPLTNAPYVGSLLNILNADAIYAGEETSDQLGVFASDDYTLTIRLNHADTSFLSTLATSVCLPCNRTFFEATIGRYGMSTDYTLCNGPYYLSSVNSSYGYVDLTLNDTYKGNHDATIPTVRFILASDQNGSATEGTDILTSLEESEDGLDAGLIGSGSVSQVPSDMTVLEYQNITKAFVMNMTSDVTKHRYFRLALATATNPQLLGASGTAEGFVPDTCELVSGQAYRDQAGSISVPKFNMTKAAKYYEKAIEKLKEKAEDEDAIDSQIYNLKVVCLTSDKKAIASVIQNWQKIFGVNLSVELVTYDTQAELDSAVNAGKYDVAYTALKASELTAANFLSRYMTGNANNVINLSHEKYDGLISTAMTATDDSTVTANLVEAEDFLVRNGCILPIKSDSTYLVTKDTASGLFVLPSGSIYAAYDIGE